MDVLVAKKVRLEMIPDRQGRTLTPRALRVFLAVVEERSMAKAAERLRISRPVVSRTIAEIEASLGVQLLDRTPRGIELTIFGESLLHRGRSVLDALRQGVEEIDFLRDPQAGELRVACTEVWAAGLVPAAIDLVLQRHPKVRVRVEQATAQNQFNLLRDRICDVVVSRLLASAPEPDIAMEALFHEPLVIVAGPDSPWTRRRNLTVAHLAGAPWILSPFEAQPGSPFEQAFRAAGLPVPTGAIYTNSLHIRNNLLATGRYLTLVPGSALRFGPERAMLKPLTVKLARWHLPTGFFIVKGRTPSPVAQLFIDSLRALAAPIAGTNWDP